MAHKTTMVALILIISVIAFVIGDLLVRLGLERAKRARDLKEREQALDIGLKLKFAEEAKSLKRVEVKEPKAKILAVDDEEVILDSFRKVLVLDGYSVDTVESGPEALLMLQKHDYDFLFTDLRMPEMDGEEVTKAARHLRPDVDIVIITGYASVESAVATMKFGAVDYVQKPFTPEELLSFTKNLLHRRQNRLEQQLKPKASLISESSSTGAPREVAILSGLFYSPNHIWVSVEPSGAVRIGIDDFAQKALSKIDQVGLPQEGATIKKGQQLFKLRQGERTISFASPFSGTIDAVNAALIRSPQLLNRKPYDSAWVCRLVPDKLGEEIKDLQIGAQALNWFQQEIDRLSGVSHAAELTSEGRLPWDALKPFFERA